MTDAPLATARYAMDHPTLAAALKLEGLEIHEASGLPRGDPPRTYKKQLADQGLLDGEGHLDPAMAEALTITAQPQQLVSILHNRAGGQAWQEVQLLRAAEPTGPQVLQNVTEAEVDLALVPSPGLAVALLDLELKLTGLPNQTGEAHVLDLRGLAALAAMTDAYQEARLQARLNRQRAPLPSVTAQDLAQTLDRGLGTPDTRWAVTALQSTSPVSLRSARNGLAGGLEQLGDRGLLQPEGQGYAFTDAGLAIAVQLGKPLDVMAISHGQLDADGEVALARLTLLRMMDSLWTITWMEPQGAATELELREINDHELIHLLRGLLAADPIDGAPGSTTASRQDAARQEEPSQAAPATGTRYCTRCGTELDAGDRFCSNCGTEQGTP